MGIGDWGLGIGDWGLGIGPKPLPVGGHGPAELLPRLRDGCADGLPDRLQPRPDSLVLQADILVDRLRLDAVMLLIFSRQFLPAFRASPHSHSSTVPHVGIYFLLYKLEFITLSVLSTPCCNHPLSK